MYTNELLEEKYKTQKKLYVEARNSHVDYLTFIEIQVKALFDEKSWKLQYSKREGVYLKSISTE